MSLNHKEIDAVLAELDVEGSHLQKIKQPNYHSLYLEFYKPGGKFGITISLASGRTRLHLDPKAPVSEIKMQRFVQFMRSRVKGGRITGIRQIGDERIIKINMSRAGEELVIWIRLWSGAANIIVSDPEGVIHDAFYRRPGRGEVSGGKFRLPEDQGKKKKREFTIRELEGEGSFNEKICRYYETLEHEEELERLRERALKKIDADYARISSIISNLEKKSKQYVDFEAYKQTADLIISNIHLIKRGMKWVKVSNYYENNEDSEIELDTTLSPGDNAEAYYQKYRKAKSGVEKVREDLLNHRLMLKHLSEDRKTIETSQDLSALRSFVSSIPKQQKTDSKEKIPGLTYRSGPFTILVGRNSKENDALLRRHVRGNDIWLHSRDYPGGYVFIKTIRGKSVPLETLLDAGCLALFYSKGKKAGKGELYYTPVKYLRRVKEGKQGLVIPTQEKNLSVIMDESRLNKLMSV